MPPTRCASTPSRFYLDAARQAVGSLHPLGHMGEPDDIAWGAVYLASDEAKFVTGTELVIDGGYTAR
jgi:NAD(P)-dependent dehydrogenase (short-subunit alcohol dehydrogenase family)